jgi:hypothetical protein
MLHKLLLINIYAVLSNFPLYLADSLTIEKTLDLTYFGTCNIYLKRFHENQVSVDLTEKLVHVQHKFRKDYALTLIDNATREFSMVSPTESLIEGCVLNIIIGIIPNDADRLDIFIKDNDYTYCSTPFSTYILIPDPSIRKVRFDLNPLVRLPVRVFYLLVSSLQNDDINLYRRPYVLVCAQCGESSWAKGLVVNSELAYVSSLNFSSSWLRNDVQIINRFHDGYDITGCEHGPWMDFSEPYEGSKRRFCNDNLAFMDLLVRSVESNLTVSAWYKTDFSDERFAGYLSFYRRLLQPSFSDAAASWFDHVGIGVLHFCDCNPKSQKEMLKAWVKPFDASVWLCLMITFLLLSLTVAVKLNVYNGFTITRNRRIKDFFVSFMTVAGIYLRQEGAIVGNRCLLLLTSFCIGVILSLYENCVTSELVVPPAKFEHNLSSLLIVPDSKVIYSGPNSSENVDLIELQLETHKWNIKYSETQLELNDELHNKNLPMLNGTCLSYFAFYPPVEIDLLLLKSKYMNNKCHCYMVKHEFIPRESYFVFELFVRNKFASTLNILRESGIYLFFLEGLRKNSNSRFLAKLRRWLEDDNYHSDFFVREEPSMELIELVNLYFILVTCGGIGVIAVCIFTLKQMDWLALFVYYKGLISKSSMCKFR